VNRSDDPANEYFADGITDDILTSLTLIEGLRVISRTSAMHYKGTTKNTRAIAEELGVEVVLEGSVRRSDNMVRVVTQLIDATRDEHLWAATYDRELEDVLAVQSDVARNVAAALESQLSARAEARLSTRAGTKSVEAYELVARARHAYLRVTQDHVDHGTRLLRQAIDLDPDYAEAWAHLAIAHFVLPYFSTVSPSSIEASAREAIDRAFALDDGLPEAYVARAHWRFNFQFDWPGAERDFGRALELNPSSADAYQWRGLMHLLCERGEQAIEDARQSVALDPLSFQTRSQLAQNLIWGGEPELARPIVEEVVQEDPSNFVARWSLGILSRSADPEGSLKQFEEALSFRDIPLGHASRSLALRGLGRTAEADRVVEELEARAANDVEYVSPFALAVAHFGRGDRDRGFEHLGHGIEDHDFLSLYMRIGLGEQIKEDLRYHQLAHRVWPDDFPLLT
jgi:TolB-like protein